MLEIGYLGQNNFNKRFLIVIIITFIYWLWESKAEGNIRIDLIICYPVLLLIYFVSLMSMGKFKALVLTIILMIINFGFMMISYELFNKNPGYKLTFTHKLVTQQA